MSLISVKEYCPTNDSQYNVKQIRLDNDILQMKQLSEFIEQYIIKNYKKNYNCYKEFKINNLYFVHNKVKKPKVMKLVSSPDNLVCFGNSINNTKNQYNCCYVHNMLDNYGKIHIYGIMEKNIYTLGTQIVWETEVSTI